jgi:hypothetical protein
MILPPPLFKYTKRIHALSLVNKGEVKIGTLHDFQRIERHAPMIGDKDEGKKARYDNPVFASAGGLSRFARPIADSVFASLPTDPAARVLFLQCSFEKIDTCPNRWLYSTSTRLGASTMHAMDPRLRYVRPHRLRVRLLPRYRARTDPAEPRHPWTDQAGQVS